MGIPQNLIIQGLINGILLGGVYALLSVGLSLFFGVTRVANSAHASFAIMGGFIAYWIFVLYGIDPILALPITMALLFIVGLAIQKVVISRVIGYPPLTAFTLTFFLSIALENIMVMAWKNEYRSIITPYAGTALIVGDFHISITRLIAFIISLLSMISLIVFLKFTYVGKAMRAISQDRNAARLCGINVDYIYMVTFGLSLTLAGIGGTLMAIIYSFYPSLQSLWIGKLYAIVILGGMGSVTGTVVAAMIWGLLDVMIGIFAPVMWGSVVSWTILLLTLLLKPKGLFGGK